MQAGGTTEIITHFIGYMDLAEEYVRDRVQYDEFANGDQSEAETAPKHDANTPKFDIEELGSVRHKLGVPPGDLPQAHELGDQLISKMAGRFPLSKKAYPPLPQQPDIPSGGGGGGPGPNTLYQEGGDQVLVRIEQHNRLVDDDMVLLTDVDISSLLRSNDQNLDAQLTAFDAALDVLPADLPGLLVGTHQELVVWAETREPGELPERPVSESTQELIPGRYVNGEQVADYSHVGEDPDGPGGKPPIEREPLPPHTELSSRPDLKAPTYDYGDMGQVAELGGNVAENIAQIVDIGGAVATMIVRGDWVETNGIYQTNVYSDYDRVTQLGEDARAEVTTGGNIVDSIAELIREAPDLKTPFPEFAGGFFRIDVVEGDLYDVKLLTQTNWIQDNDITVQNSWGSFATINAGGNEQINAIDLVEAFQNYDIIIIGGNYHTGNLIYQTNILLDDDYVVASAGNGDATDQTVLTGQNWLFNSATIRDLGVDTYSPFSSGVTGFHDQIAARSSYVDPGVTHGWGGNGSPVLNVLYIEGDYFDLNMINQVNVVLDADAALQHMPSGAGTEGFTQYVSTGNNGLANHAEIVTIGVIDELFVAGEHYEDAILVQADIALGQDDEVAWNDPSKLVPELVAFTTDIGEGVTAPVTPSDPTVPGNDMSGNVLL